MKKIVSILMLVFALILGGCGAGGDFVNEDYKFENLQNQINVSNARIDELIIQVNALAAAAAGTVTQDQIDVLQNQINALTTQLSALQTQVGTDNTALTASIAGLTERITTLEGTVAILQAKVNGQAVEIAELIFQIGILNAKVDALLLKIALLEQDVPCDEGSTVYTGSGDPSGTANVGDLYFDTKTEGLVGSENNKKHNVWIYKSGGWVYYGQIEK